MIEQRHVPIIIMIGGVLGAVGSFMPWVTVKTAFGSVSRNGVEGGGDGIITLVLGIALAVLGYRLLAAPSVPSWDVVAVAGVLAAFGVFEFFSVQERIADSASEFAVADVGTGIYAILVGAGVAFVAGIGWLDALVSRPPPAPAPPPPPPKS